MREREEVETTVKNDYKELREVDNLDFYVAEVVTISVNKEKDKNV